MPEHGPAYIIMPKYKCLRCGYEWIPRSPTAPETCANPKCRSTSWWKVREEENGGEAK